MILPPLRYMRPHSLTEAVEMLAAVDGAAVLSGGQTLINILKLDLARPSALVDVHRLDELRGVEVRDDGAVVIGAATTYAMIANSPDVARVQPSVAEMAAGLVDRQVRNRGTIGGNCCLNDPTNNFPPLLVALGARFHLAGAEGGRVLDSAEFFVGTLATALRPGELLVSVEIPPLPEGARVAHRHLQVGADSWAMARAVVRLDVGGPGDMNAGTDGGATGKVRHARVVVGAVLGAPRRLVEVEQALIGQPVGSGLVGLAEEAFDRERVETVDDVHCSADYRRKMCKVQVRRAIGDAVEERA